MAVFSLFDVKAEVFGRLFEGRTCEDAKRMFVSLLLTRDVNNITQYPQDYNLYQLGDFDCDTGSLKPVEPNCIMTGFEAVKVARAYHNDLFTEEKGDVDDGITDESSSTIESAVSC